MDPWDQTLARPYFKVGFLEGEGECSGDMRVRVLQSQSSTKTEASVGMRGWQSWTIKWAFLLQPQAASARLEWGGCPGQAHPKSVGRTFLSRGICQLTLRKQKREEEETSCCWSTRAHLALQLGGSSSG